MALRSPWQRQHEGRTSQQRDACPALQRQLSPAACTARALMLHAKTLEEQSFLSAIFLQKGRSLLLTLYKRLLINLLAGVVILLAAVGVDLRRSIQPSGKVQEKRSLSMGSNLQLGYFKTSLHLKGVICPHGCISHHGTSFLKHELVPDQFQMDQPHCEGLMHLGRQLI